MTLAIDAEDNSGNSGNLRSVQKNVGSFTTVVMDQSHVGKRVEGAGGRSTRESQFIQTCQKQIAALAIFVACLIEQ